MPQAVWTGSLAFGLVSIPVKLYNATSPKDVRFRQFQAGTAKRIRHRRVVESDPEPEPAPEQELQTDPEPAPPRRASRDAADQGSPPPSVTAPAKQEAEVAFEDVMKGYEIEPDRFVMIDPQELESLAPERSHTIEIAEFVDLADIDPVFFEKSYYVAPGPGGEKPYWLLQRAMREAGRVAVATFVMRTKEYLAAVRSGDEVIALETLFYADEVRNPRELGMPRPSEPAPRELDIAERLIESLATMWDPSRHRDRYRDRVLELIAARAEGAVQTVPQQAEPEPSRVPDLMAALQASLEAIKERKEPARKPARRRRTG